MKIKDIIAEIERFAPPTLQEPYDNSGLLAGNANTQVAGVLLSLDCTESVVDEAIDQNCNLIVSHHPLIFSGLKSITGKNYVERTLIKAIKNDVVLYAAHTNLDHVAQGVNKKISDKLGLTNTKILSPKPNLLRKLITFVPKIHLQSLQSALFEAGAGQMGNYTETSFWSSGTGSFKPNNQAKPYVGNPNERHSEPESRLEIVFETHNEQQIIQALIKNHPYEEVAYDVITLQKSHQNIGSGMVGVLPKPMSEPELMELIKHIFGVKTIRHTELLGKKVEKIAVCGGSGRFLLPNAIAQQADVFVTADFKYHEFFDAQRQIVVMDIGHYESEQFTVEIFDAIIRKKFSNFVPKISKINTNPIFYT